jgi:hypothetical protein
MDGWIYQMHGHVRGVALAPTNAIYPFPCSNALRCVFKGLVCTPFTERFGSQTTYRKVRPAYIVDYHDDHMWLLCG